MRKAYRRNRGAILTGGGFALLLIMGLVATSIGFQKATREQARATIAEQNAIENALKAMDSAEDAQRERDEAIAARGELGRTLYLADMPRASIFWRASDMTGCLETLAAHIPHPGQPDLRGPEWHYLDRQLRSDGRAVPLPTNPKYPCPDGRHVAMYHLGPTPTTVTEYDLSRPETPAHKFDPFHGEDWTPMFPLQYSRDGNRFLVGAFPGEIGARFNSKFQYRVFDKTTRKTIFTHDAVDGSHLACDQQMRFFVAGKSDPGGKSSTLFIREIDSGKTVFKISITHVTTLRAINAALSPDGKRLTVLSKSNEENDDWRLQIWNVEDGSDPVETEVIEESRGLSYSPDGTLLFQQKSHQYQSIGFVVRNATDGSVIRSVKRGTNESLSWTHEAFSHDGKWWAYWDRKQLSIWRLEDFRTADDPRPIREIPLATDVRGIAFSSDDRFVMAGSADPLLQVWEVRDSATIEQPPPPHLRPSFGMPGHWVVAGQPSRFAAVWVPGGFDTRDGRVQKLTDQPVGCHVRVWDETGRVVFTTEDELAPGQVVTGRGSKVALNQDATRVALLAGYTIRDPVADNSPSQRETRLRVWNIADGTELFRRDWNEELEAENEHVFPNVLHGFSPDGDRLLVSSSKYTGKLGEFDNRLSIWNLSGKVDPINHSWTGMIHAVSPDGSRILLGEGTSLSCLSCREIETNRVLWRRDNSLPMGGANFSPDGSHIVLLGVFEPRTGSRDVPILDAASGQTVGKTGKLSAQSGGIQAVQLTPDNQRAVGIVLDRKSKIYQPFGVIWDVATGRELLSVPIPAGSSELAINQDGQRIHWQSSTVEHRGEVRVTTWDMSPLPEQKK